MISLNLMIEPVAWQRVKRGMKGQAYVPHKTRRFKSEAAKICKMHLNQLEAKGFPLKKPVRLTAKFFLSKPKRPKFPIPGVRPDLDNYVKALKDALNGILWADDSLICEYGPGTGKFYTQQGMGFISLSVEELKGGAGDS